MKAFKIHDDRVNLIKNKLNYLKKNLPFGEVLIKSDFIQNIVHKRGAEPTTGYYDKRQTQLLTFVVWCHAEDWIKEKPVIELYYFDYLSAYLKHTSLFFQKCFTHLNQYLNENLPHKITKVGFLYPYCHSH